MGKPLWVVMITEFTLGAELFLLIAVAIEALLEDELFERYLVGQPLNDNDIAIGVWTVLDAICHREIIEVVVALVGIEVLVTNQVQSGLGRKVVPVRYGQWVDLHRRVGQDHR